MAQRRTDTDGSSRERKRSARQQEREQYDMAGIDPDVLLQCLTRVANKGGAIRLGLTRDGGALAIGIYGDGNQEPYTEYLRPGQDPAEYFQGLGLYFDDLPQPKA